MSDQPTSLVEAPRQHDRVLGRIKGRNPGPSVIVLSGIHGNEPAGVRAALRVLAGLDPLRSQVRGEVVFLAGNLTALRERSRFIHSDLNRQWRPELVEQLRARGADNGNVEYRELLELLGTLERVVAGRSDALYFLDLHTSSAQGAPFVTVGDTLRNRHFARRLPLPLILGLEEQVDGALLEYLNNVGCITMGVEGGHHEAPASVDRLEAVIWLALCAAGLLDEGEIPKGNEHRRLLVEASRGVPRVVEVRRRHAISEEDGFRMEPGFTNFQPVKQGTLLARDSRGPIHASEPGLLLLPLYQGQGDDGFFLSREVRMFWLNVSAALRRLHLYNLVPVLPGVRRRSEPNGHDVLVVDTRIARWYPLEIFHLFGFRKLRKVGSELVVSRRRYDLQPPRDISLSSEV